MRIKEFCNYLYKKSIGRIVDCLKKPNLFKRFCDWAIKWLKSQLEWLKWLGYAWLAAIQLLLLMWAFGGNLWILFVEAIVLFLWWQYRKFKKEHPAP